MINNQKTRILKQEYFREVVGNPRDSGILIASGRDGYKSQSSGFR
jgi:hypothetical protein